MPFQLSEAASVTLIRRWKATISNLVTDPATGSVGQVTRSLGLGPDPLGKPSLRLEVCITEAHAHHRLGDLVIWRIHA